MSHRITNSNMMAFALTILVFILFTCMIQSFHTPLHGVHHQRQQLSISSTSTSSSSSSSSKRQNVANNNSNSNIISNSSSNTSRKIPRSTITSNSPPTSSSSSSSSMNNKKEKLPLPLFDIDNLGIKGDWYESRGNYILKPPRQWLSSSSSSSSSTYDNNDNSNSGNMNNRMTREGSRKPLGVIHFLGGAFVGAAPQLTYKYLLESLAAEGYIIVATPYRLNMDYVKICDDILAKFEGVGIELAGEYGALPVIGLGHSCGALLQTLITSLFPDTPRALNILISYNNKPANKAIPAFQEIIIPISQYIFSTASGTTASISSGGSTSSGGVSGNMGTTTTTTATTTTTNNNNQNPNNNNSINNNNDTNLNEMQKIRSFLTTARSTVDEFLKEMSEKEYVPAFVEKELYPLFLQSLEVGDQLVPLLNTIALGATEFSPSPVDTKETCRRMYRARKTLLIKFNNDALDESTEIEKVLREANTIMRMKRPMVEMEVELKILDGTHITPLTQNILDPPTILTDNPQFKNLDVFKSFRDAQNYNFLKTVNQVKNEILIFLDNSIVRRPPLAIL